ncbi:hypothetical protein J6590_076954 [Homalodisca vitripennis]|nr:hypothetical protein J6590_076954 [Homalodisca vitripennis]
MMQQRSAVEQSVPPPQQMERSAERGERGEITFSSPLPPLPRLPRRLKPGRYNNHNELLCSLSDLAAQRTSGYRPVGECLFRFRCSLSPPSPSQPNGHGNALSVSYHMFRRVQDMRQRATQRVATGNDEQREYRLEEQRRRDGRRPFTVTFLQSGVGPSLIK